LHKPVSIKKIKIKKMLELEGIPTASHKVNYDDVMIDAINRYIA